MIPVYKDENKEFIEVTVGGNVDGATYAFQQAALQEWFKRGFEPYCIYFVGEVKHYCMKRVKKRGPCSGH